MCGPALGIIHVEECATPLLPMSARSGAFLHYKYCAPIPQGIAHLYREERANLRLLTVTLLNLELSDDRIHTNTGERIGSEAWPHLLPSRLRRALASAGCLAVQEGLTEMASVQNPYRLRMTACQSALRLLWIHLCFWRG